MLAVIDMDMGNLQSVLEGFRRVGGQPQVTTRAEEIERATAVILPGVGAFGDGMASLRQKGLVGPLRRHAVELKKPLFGICLGMQLLADEGEEHGRHRGLGLISGRTVRLRPTEPGCRVPNMGWCDVAVPKRQSALFAAIPQGEPFYFAHSYHVVCADPADVAATIDYGGPVTAGIERDNLFGVQFHPEKSQDAGLDVLASFVEHVRRAVV